MRSTALHARLLGATGASLAAMSVALGAYASHAASPDAARRLGIAAAFAFGHGLALVALAPGATRTPERLGLYAIATGTLAFAGSLAGAALIGTGTSVAPAGGLALIAGWLLIAFARARG
ncbi:DUF423 domain-containing protein [Lysobacter humi (ex Lee et al. 2017)]